MYIKEPNKPEMDGEYMDLGILNLKDFKLKTLEGMYDIKDEDDEIF